jgi:hypothetical protein
VLRSPWVAAKLVLTLVVIVAGALVVGPAEGVLLTDPLSASARSAAEQRALVGEVVQILSLLAAVALSVYKPGRTRPRTAR